MIGYATSADDRGNCENIIITVLFADDFSFEEYDSRKEVYAVCRNRKHITKISSVDGHNTNIHYDSLFKIASVLHLEEIKASLAVRVAWRLNDSKTVQVVNCEADTKVWLPLPVINEGCRHICINVTEQLFDRTPKPLEASLVCDMLNMTLLKAGIPVANPFYNCFNSVFCTSELVGTMSLLLGDEFLDVSHSDTLSLILVDDMKSFKTTRITEKKVITALTTCGIPAAVFDGNALSFFVNTKRACLKSVVEAFEFSVKNKTGYKAFFKSVASHIAEAVKLITTLADLFVLSGSINGISDIMYLTSYDVQSAFAFSESRLRLKTTVREGRRRMTILNRLYIPAVIYSDGYI